MSENKLADFFLFIKAQESLILVAFTKGKNSADTIVWESIRMAVSQSIGPSKLLRYAN